MRAFQFKHDAESQAETLRETPGSSLSKVWTSGWGLRHTAPPPCLKPLSLAEAPMLPWAGRPRVPILSGIPFIATAVTRNTLEQIPPSGPAAAGHSSPGNMSELCLPFPHPAQNNSCYKITDVVKVFMVSVIKKKKRKKKDWDYLKPLETFSGVLS